MPQIMKTDKVANPKPVGFLRAPAVPARPHDCFYVILKPQWASCEIHQLFPPPIDFAYMSNGIGRGKRGSHDTTWRIAEK
jgi:hypothetical protein